MENKKVNHKLASEIENLRSVVAFLKSVKLSKGLNDHDNKQYENYKKQLEDKSKMLSLTDNIAS